MVYDNASQDNSAELAKSHPVRPAVIRSAYNFGFAHGVNAAVATTEDFDYLLLLNPDAVLHPATIDALWEATVHFPEAGIYGGKSVSSDKRSKPGSVLGRPSVFQAVRFAACCGVLPFTARWEPDAISGGEPQGVCEVPAIEGSMLLISALAWKSLEGFDESFFLYGEDVDLCVRAYRMGFRVIYSEKATYTHMGGASSSNKAESTKRMLRGKRMLYERYAAGRLGIFLLAIGVFLRATFEPLIRSDDKWRYCWRERSYWLGRKH